MWSDIIGIISEVSLEAGLDFSLLEVEVSMDSSGSVQVVGNHDDGLVVL